jgi:hypothetical protein
MGEEASSSLIYGRPGRFGDSLGFFAGAIDPLSPVTRGQMEPLPLSGATF